MRRSRGLEPNSESESDSAPGVHYGSTEVLVGLGGPGRCRESRNMLSTLLCSLAQSLAAQSVSAQDAGATPIPQESEAVAVDPRTPPTALPAEAARPTSNWFEAGFAYRIGPVTVAREQTEWFADVSHSRVSFDLKDTDTPPGTFSADDNPMQSTSTELRLGWGLDSWSFEFNLAEVGLEDDAERSTEGGYLAGARIGWSRPVLERFVWGVDASLAYAQADLIDPILQQGNVYWIQADVRTGLALVPSRSAFVALAPYAGVGVRRLDGIQENSSGSYAAELDTTLPYAFLGAALIWRPTESTHAQLALEGQAGDLLGFTITASYSF